MTARQRPAAGIATTDQAAPAPVLHWEDWFQGATSAQRAEALALAQQQGLLYLHQLPAVNGSRSAPPADDDTAARPLAELLAGRAEPLPAFTPEPLEALDSELDEMQRLAVARALATPDVCLIQGLPGTGKSRVVAEILAQAARRGWRALLVAEEAPPLDVVLHRLVGRKEVLPIRFLETTERAEDLPPWLRGFTAAEQQQAFLARTLAGARQSLEEAETRCRQRASEEKCWPQLRSLVVKAEALRRRLADLRGQQNQIAGNVRRESEGLPCVGKGLPSGPFAAEYLSLLQPHEDALQALQADQATLTEKRVSRVRERDIVNTEAAALEPAYQAKSQGRWWTAAYWRATLRGGVPAQMSELNERKARSQAAVEKVEAEIAQLGQRRQQLVETFRADIEALCKGEVARRQQELLGRQRDLEHELQDVQERGRELALALTELLRPADLSPVSLEPAQARWQRQRSQDEQDLQFARQWVDYLEGAGPQLAGRLPQLANLLVGTCATVLQDAAFREALAGSADLLVIEEAERLTEAELLRLARHARRVVLIGQVLADSSVHRPTEKGARVSGVTLAPTCWARLWHALGGDASCLPYSWYREGDRLVCQLVPLRVEDRAHLESECLADAADVELRILNHPKGRPSLAQVAFPGTVSLQEAFALIVREVGEVPLPPAGRSAWWHEDDAGCSWRVGPAALPVHEHVEVEPGLRVGLWGDPAGRAWRATRVEFSRAAGWDRPRAEAWVAMHVPGRDTGRAVSLQIPYRFARPLAEAVSGVLCPEESLWSLLPEKPAAEPLLEFIAVPPLRKPEMPREGAGLEVDLTATRHADRLPADLRHGLPPVGFANYLEAQAVVRRLEQLAQTPGALPVGRREAPEVVVLALFEGQADLLRRLLSRSEVLRAHPIPFEVAVHAQLRQRECAVVLLSLTRSHAHRSVPFGADVADLAVALTRARHKLYVFGDPGTLVKRTHWQGPLDHLPAAPAHQELLRLTRLVRYLQATLLARPQHAIHENGR